MCNLTMEFRSAHKSTPRKYLEELNQPDEDNSHLDPYVTALPSPLCPLQDPMVTCLESPLLLTEPVVEKSQTSQIEADNSGLPSPSVALNISSSRTSIFTIAKHKKVHLEGFDKRMNPKMSMSIISPTPYRASPPPSSSRKNQISAEAGLREHLKLKTAPTFSGLSLVTWLSSVLQEAGSGRLLVSFEASKELGLVVATQLMNLGIFGSLEGGKPFKVSVTQF